MIAYALALIFASTGAIANPLSHLLLDRIDLAAQPCAFPNNSATAVHVYNCDTTVPIQVTSASVTDTNGVVNYPIDPHKPISIHLNAINNGQEYFDDKSNVKLYEYSRNVLTSECRWVEVPTLGLFNNIDGCQIAHNCPLTIGPLDLGITLDLTPFAAILTALVADRPYAIEIRMYDYNEGSPHEEISCTVSQVKFAL